MKSLGRIVFILLFAIALFSGCASTQAPVQNTPPIPLKEANLQAVLEENEGLEIREEDAKELRDFYRGGVQLKARGEKSYQEKAYPLAIKMFEDSNYFFSKILRYIEEDSADYPLFEDTKILFFPNLLTADNYVKLGLIYHTEGNEGAARRSFGRANSFVKKSLQSEPTEWGLQLQEQIRNLLSPPRSY